MLLGRKPSEVSGMWSVAKETGYCLRAFAFAVAARLSSATESSWPNFLCKGMKANVLCSEFWLPH